MQPIIRKLFLYAVVLALGWPLASLQAQLPQLPESWKVSAGLMVDSCPAMDQNGTLYVTSSGGLGRDHVSGGRLMAITSKGVKKWEFKIFSEIKSSPALGGDGTVYFGSRDRKFYAVNSNGLLKWSFSTANWIDSSPAIGTNGVIYFGGWDSAHSTPLKPDGSKLWAFVTGGPVDSSPAIGADGTIYFGSHDRNFYALNPDGSKKWAFATGGAIVSSPALNADGLIYISSADGRLCTWRESRWQRKVAFLDRWNWRILPGDRWRRQHLHRSNQHEQYIPCSQTRRHLKVEFRVSNR